jgi:hypothetical protein
MARVRTKSFLDDARREWQFDVFAWLLRNSGGYARFRDTALALPTAEEFPANGMRGHAAASAIFRRVRDRAGMADWPCAIEPASRAPPSASRPADPGAIPIIRYPPADADLALVPTFARELARFLVETFVEPPPGGDAFTEPAIDLAVVFMGFGVFIANAARAAPRYDLNEGEFVNALAIFCLLGKTSPSEVEPHLDPHLRKYLRLAARDLDSHPEQFRRLRAIVAADEMPESMAR